MVDDFLSVTGRSVPAIQLLLLNAEGEVMWVCGDGVCVCVPECER